MDVKKFIEENGLSQYPVGLGGCRTSDLSFDSCDYDIFVFDEKSESDKIIKFDDEFVTLHHESVYESKSEKLLQYDQMQIIHDESWDLRILLAKIHEKKASLFSDFAKNCLIESQFCCQKTKEAIESGDVFSPCWQKCASYYLANGISAINNNRLSPSHMLDSLRKLKKNSINKHISVVTQTVGIERATPTLLERMLKSTIGFSDLIENNSHSEIIQQKHDYFVKNSMLSDCYFYLGCVNKEIFIQIKDALNREQDLIHILKIAFDVEVDRDLLKQQSALVQNSCNEILETLASA